MNARTPEGAVAPAEPEPVEDEVIHPRADLMDGVAWVLFGLAVLIGSITMDRLEQQSINPYTVPGLLPGLLGLAMVLLGGLLLVRSLARGALRSVPPPASADQGERRRRIAIVAVLCLGYGVVLVGHGLPFWLASAIYVTASILILRRISRDPDERRLTPRAVLMAVVIGLASAVITHLVFQELFLVRLP